MSIAIELKNVSKKMKDKVLYSDLDLQIPVGACVGFVGQNGAGKSVLFQLITGLMSVSSGIVLVNGKEVGGKDGVFPKDVGVLINSPGYIDFYSGYKNLKLLADINNTISEKDIENTMSLVGLDPQSKLPVKKYSMGMKQKLGIAQAIMENQSIVILDEPYNALDFQTNQDVTQIIKRLKSECKTVLFTSHQHEYLEKLCDDVYFIQNGKLTPFDDEIKARYFMI